MASDALDESVKEPLSETAKAESPNQPENTAGAESADVGEGEDASVVAVSVGELNDEERLALVEALIFAHGEPLSASKIASIVGLSDEELAPLLATLCDRYKVVAHGFDLVVVAGQYQFRTKSLYSEYVRELKAGAPRRLSAPALETLAIIAYRQPIVKSDVERIRGVDATPTLKTLLERGLIKIVGHQHAVGQPALYGTTDEFLKLFGLANLAELPSLRDLRELEADPGEDDEASPAANETNDQAEEPPHQPDGEPSEQPTVANG